MPLCSSHGIHFRLPRLVIRCSILFAVQNVKINIHRTTVLLVVLYGCKTWSLILRVERKLRVFENRVLRRIFRPKRDEVTGEWRKLHNEELYDMYSPNIIRVMESRRIRWAGHVGRMTKGRGYAGVWWDNLRESVHLEDPGVDERIILKWTFKNGIGRRGLV